MVNKFRLIASGELNEGVEYSASRPVRAPNGVLWHAYSKYFSSTGLYGIYVAYSLNGGLSWIEEEVIDPTTSEQGYPHGSAVAVDSQNNIHVVWEGRDWDGVGYRTTQYRRRLASGVWEDRVALDNASTDNCEGPIRLEIDKDDTLHVVWGRNVGGYYRAYYNQRTSGGAWGTLGTIVSPFGGDRDAEDLRSDPNGNLYFLNYYSTDGLTWQLRVRKRSDSTWGSAVLVTDRTAARGRMAIDSNGNLHIVYDAITGLYYKQISADGTLGSEEIITEIGGILISLGSIGLSPDEKTIHVVWTGPLIAGGSPYVLQCDRTSEGWGEIANLDPTGDYGNPRLIDSLYPSSNRRGFAMVVDGPTDLWGQYFYRSKYLGNPNIDQLIYQHVERMTR